tara:strand:+ start:724 stop:1644 length:921 start_codon:yes stop_codon:yes gene_type:complete
VTKPNKKIKNRDINGVLLLDKPLGCSSNSALQKVKRLYQAKKAGHTGSLDPLASGMLPICFGSATKLSAFLLDADKDYWVRVKMGEKTETGDAEGKVIKKRSITGINEGLILEALDNFKGEILQTPPMFSAIKHKGKRLYELAREGVVVERKQREITIHKLQLCNLESNFFDLHISCSKGTYVRTLAEDIGETLGCGAHVSELKRERVGPYKKSDMITLDVILDKADESFEALERLLLPIDSALSSWPALSLNSDSAYYLKTGQAVMVPKAPTEGWVRLYEETDKFIGIGQVEDDGKIAPKRLMMK